MGEAHCLQHPRQNDQHVVNLKCKQERFLEQVFTTNDYLVSFLPIKLLGFEIKETTLRQTIAQMQVKMWFHTSWYLEGKFRKSSLSLASIMIFKSEKNIHIGCFSFITTQNYTD